MKEVECSWCLGMKQVYVKKEDKMIQCSQCGGTGHILMDDDYDDTDPSEDLFTQFDENIHGIEGGDDE